MRAAGQQRTGEFIHHHIAGALKPATRPWQVTNMSRTLASRAAFWADPVLSDRDHCHLWQLWSQLCIAMRVVPRCRDDLDFSPDLPWSGVLTCRLPVMSARGSQAGKPGGPERRSGPSHH
jgi:hypothetical protein